MMSSCFLQLAGPVNAFLLNQVKSLLAVVIQKYVLISEAQAYGVLSSA